MRIWGSSVELIFFVNKRLNKSLTRFINLIVLCNKLSLCIKHVLMLDFAIHTKDISLFNPIIYLMPYIYIYSLETAYVIVIQIYACWRTIILLPCISLFIDGGFMYKHLSCLGIPAAILCCFSLCAAIRYALQFAMRYNSLCATIRYALQFVMRYNSRCATIRYALQFAMRYNSLCATIRYELQFAMRYNSPCATIRHALQYAMRYNSPCSGAITPTVCKLQFFVWL